MTFSGFLYLDHDSSVTSRDILRLPQYHLLIYIHIILALVDIVRTITLNEVTVVKLPKFDYLLALVFYEIDCMMNFLYLWNS